MGFGWHSRDRQGCLPGRTFSRILWMACPVRSVAFVTAGFTAAIVLSATSLATRTVASAAGVMATTTSFVALPTAWTAGRKVWTALSNAGWRALAARSNASVPVVRA